MLQNFKHKKIINDIKYQNLFYLNFLYLKLFFKFFRYLIKLNGISILSFIVV